MSTGLFLGPLVLGPSGVPGRVRWELLLRDEVDVLVRHGNVYSWIRDREPGSALLRYHPSRHRNRGRRTDENEEPVEVFTMFPEGRKIVLIEELNELCGFGIVNISRLYYDRAALPTVIGEQMSQARWEELTDTAVLAPYLLQGCPEIEIDIDRRVSVPRTPRGKSRSE